MHGKQTICFFFFFIFHYIAILLTFCLNGEDACFFWYNIEFLTFYYLTAKYQQIYMNVYSYETDWVNNFQHLFTRNCHLLKLNDAVMCTEYMFMHVYIHVVYTLCHEFVGFSNRLIAVRQTSNQTYQQKKCSLLYSVRVHGVMYIILVCTIYHIVHVSSIWYFIFFSFVRLTHCCRIYSHIRHCS